MAAIKSSKFCFAHSPSHGRKRAEARKRGGQRRRVPHAGDAASMPAQVRTLADAMLILDYCLAEVIPMENSIQRGRLLIALCEAYFRGIEVGGIEERLNALELKLL